MPQKLNDLLLMRSGQFNQPTLSDIDIIARQQAIKNKPQRYEDVLGQTQSTLTLGGLLNPSNIRDFVVGRPQDAFNPNAPGIQIGDAEGPSLYLPGQALGVVDLATLPFLGAYRMSRGLVRPVAPFFSQLRKTLSERMPERAAADQILAIAKKGAKAEELEYSGLMEFLKNRPKATKTEVMQHLEANAPELREIIISRTSPETGPYRYDEVKYQPKFTKWTLPGGENQRELVVTMSSKKPILNEQGLEKIMPAGTYSDYTVPSGHAYGDPELDTNRLFHARMNDRDGGKTLFMEELQSDWHQTGRDKGYTGQLSLPPNHKLRKFEDKADVEDSMALIGEDVDAAKPGDWVVEDADGNPVNWGPGHFSEDAIMREFASNDPEGWGRMVGVPDAPFKNTWHELGMKRMLQEAVEGNYERLSWTTGKQQADRYSLRKQVDRLRYNPQTQELTGYLDRMMSPVITEKVPPERLREYIGDEPAKKLLETKVHPPEFIRDTEFIEDMANPQKTRRIMHEISGVDLELGGEGMKKFYDEMLVSAANKLAKKHGGKVTKSEMPNPGKFIDMDGGVIPPDELDRILRNVKRDEIANNIEYIEGLSFNELVEAVGEEQAALSIANTTRDHAMREMRQILADQEYRRIVEYRQHAEGVTDLAIDLGLIKPATEEVWSLEITPQMRKAIMEEGQPLFGKAPMVPATGGKRDDDSNDAQLRDLMRPGSFAGRR